VGTNHPGEIEPLTELVRPHCSILLNVHNAHIENFPSREALIDEKCSIFAHLQGPQLRIAEDTLDLEGYRFGFSAGSHAQVLEVRGDLLNLQLFGRNLRARIPGGGHHRALTLAAVILATELLGVDTAAALALEENVVPQGRGNVLHCAGIDLIDDSYNANPASMQAALQAFAQKSVSGRKFVLLGEMLELGDVGSAAHKAIIEEASQFDGCFLVGAGFAESSDAHVFHCDSADAMLIARLVHILRPGDSLLIKGSNRVFWATDFVQQLAQALRESKS
jgi:UDP-N-acetylmuramoyl-tripeptide--D-alanyl-D-alanine ligase